MSLLYSTSLTGSQGQGLEYRQGQEQEYRQSKLSQKIPRVDTAIIKKSYNKYDTRHENPLFDSIRYDEMVIVLKNIQKTTFVFVFSNPLFVRFDQTNIASYKINPSNLVFHSKSFRATRYGKWVHLKIQSKPHAPNSLTSEVLRYVRKRRMNPVKIPHPPRESILL